MRFELHNLEAHVLMENDQTLKMWNHQKSRNKKPVLHWGIHPSKNRKTWQLRWANCAAHKPSIEIHWAVLEKQHLL